MEHRYKEGRDARAGFIWEFHLTQTADQLDCRMSHFARACGWGAGTWARVLGTPRSNWQMAARLWPNERMPDQCEESEWLGATTFSSFKGPARQFFAKTIYTSSTKQGTSCKKTAALPAQKPTSLPVPPPRPLPRRSGSGIHSTWCPGTPAPVQPTRTVVICWVALDVPQPL